MHLLALVLTSHMLCKPYLDSPKTQVQYIGKRSSKFFAIWREHMNYGYHMEELQRNSLGMQTQMVIWPKITMRSQVTSWWGRFLDYQTSGDHFTIYNRKWVYSSNLHSQGSPLASIPHFPTLQHHSGGHNTIFWQSISHHAYQRSSISHKNETHQRTISFHSLDHWKRIPSTCLLPNRQHGCRHTYKSTPISKSQTLCSRTWARIGLRGSVGMSIMPQAVYINMLHLDASLHA